MPSNCRINDLFSGVCMVPLHGPVMGYVLTASPNVLINGQQAARQMDLVMAFCGDIGFIITASSTVMINGMGAARIGDSVGGILNGTLITGSGDTETGG